MKSLSEISCIHNLDARLINAAAVLEAELREGRVTSEMTLGQLVQQNDELRNAKNGEFIRDVNFALGIRNAVCHPSEIHPTDAEKHRASTYLLEGIIILREAKGIATPFNLHEVWAEAPQISRDGTYYSKEQLELRRLELRQMEIENEAKKIAQETQAAWLALSGYPLSVIFVLVAVYFFFVRHF